MLDTISQRTRQLWAKTGEDRRWLSLQQHMRDSADAAGFLWDEWLSADVKRTLIEHSSLKEAELRPLVTWLAGTHDIGKASKPFAFQLDQSPDHRWLSERVRNTGFDSNRFSELGIEVEDLPHSVYSQGIQTWWLCETFGWNSYSAERLAGISGAHHGLPPTEDQLSKLHSSLLATHGEDWQQAWRELLSDITAHTGAEEILRGHPKLKIPVNAQMVLTGLVIMSDWIASNPEFFPLSRPEAPITAAAAQDRGRAGIDSLQLPDPWRPAQQQGDTAAFYRQRFDWPEDFHPNQLQRVAAKLGSEAISPGLFIIEAPMGTGKTEAGLALADLLAQQLGVGGLMFATPTTATSDGLFGRTLTWARNTQPGGSLTSMFLAHSRNTLSDSFMRLRYERAQAEQTEEESNRGQAISHDWLYGRKKGILSHIVIGTVDQVLQMALQTRHVMLKHLGFSGKVVVIDEVHAYDSYMQIYLQRALQWLASYGVTVILLSATLPQSVRVELSNAYRTGLGAEPRGEPEGHRAQNQEPEKIVLELSYPLITQVDVAGTHQHAVSIDSETKNVTLHQIDDSLGTLEEKLEPVRIDGGCAVVICNTVKRAQAVYERLKPIFGDDVSLLHARFTAIDRKEKEETLLSFFGSSSNRGSGRPERRVLVATQIVEQSLDLDFDLMITDFCPADLLLQRAGRLHRHRRPAEDRPGWSRQPTIYVRGIEQAGDENEPPVFSSDYRAIYAEAILLASYALLLPKFQQGEQLRIPDEISALVQHTYRSAPAIPEAWADAYRQARTKLVEEIHRKQAKASGFLLKDHRGHRTIAEIMPYREARVKEHVDELRAAAQVRDIDPALEVLLVQRVAGEYRLLPGHPRSDEVISIALPPDEEIAKAIALNSVRLPYYFSRPRAFDAALDELERSYFIDSWQQSHYLRSQLILPLDEKLEVELAGQRLRYSSELGLQHLANLVDAAPEDT
ncbi:CRISPR-associated helicase Cas3' [Leucobacter weissii]|uniref:CRISPR-associated helicase Cas3 n=1 Tax=Leucobacter weissii TaxID=1983706 RepID=A0A939SAJ6_9MICO|nr:CRISPR-associated helicase Cas3' [Leucobacter weissii]MBO1900535.1 CRISPR-associated helicase Cas3' [Leucobacter weissii]